MIKSFLLLAILLLFLAPKVSKAAVLAYEGFSVPANYKSNGGYANPLDGNSNALVWDEDHMAEGSVGQAPSIAGFGNTGWQAQTGTTISSNIYPRVQNSQTMQYQTASGQRLNTSTGEVSLFRGTDFPPTYKSFERDLTIPSAFSATPLYISGMFRFTNSVVTSRLESAFTDGTGTRPFGVRIDETTSKMYAFGAGVTGEIEVATISAGTTYFFVWELSNATHPGVSPTGPTGDSLKIYLNPVDLASQSANVATATLSSEGANFFVHNNAAWSMDKWVFGASMPTTNQWLLDEFRFGTTWADVTSFTVVPEPSRALLILIAFGGWILQRRRS